MTAKESRPPSSHPERLLLVDDDSQFLEMLGHMVTRLGYPSTAANGAAEALAALDAEPCDLVITDLQMPEMDGMELLHALRQRHPGLPALALTGHGGVYTYRQVIDAGAADFIEKPVRPSELAAKLERIFRERQMRLALEREGQTQAILCRLMQLSLISDSLPATLERCLANTLSMPWLELQAKGLVLLKDEQDPETLVVAVQRGLDPSLSALCARVPFGHCLCGRAAAQREVVFAATMDHRHETRLADMAPHGHYCLPLLASSGEVQGVFTVYLRHGASRDPQVENALRAVASTLAGIIEHHRTARALTNQERIHRAITATAGDGIVMMDRQGRIFFWNPAAARIFGYTAQEAMGQELHRLLVPEEARERWASGVAAFGRSGTGPLVGRTVELNACHRDGRPVPVELSLAGVELDGQPAAVAIIRDITLRRQQEAEREALQVQLRQAQKMEAIGTLAGGIAHDFNNILAAILGFGDMAQEQTEAGSQLWQDISHILAAGRRARDLVQQILTFSRRQEGERHPIRVQHVIKEAVKLLRAVIPAQISIRQHIHQDCGLVEADPTQLHQLLMNLCTNAYHAMGEEGGVLSVRLERHRLEALPPRLMGSISPGPCLRLQVADTGCGMDEATLERIFEPYFTTKKPGQGTGLGLSVVHGIVTSLGGGIAVTSQPGAGSVFDVFLPLCETPVEERAANDGRPAWGRGRLLFVDDEPDLVEIACRGLRALGYTVAGHTDSRQALAQFLRQPEAFDLLVTDNAMPGLTGLQLGAAVIGLRPDLPVLMVTGHGESLTLEQAQASGIRQVLCKPVATADLGRSIRGILDQAAAGNGMLNVE
ncbi:MAG: response regulator [Thermodesulfobacteriota bacterium]